MGDDYFHYMQKTGVTEIRSTEGNRGVYVLRRDEGNEAEFLFISIWDSFEAIRKFAGPATEKAVYYPKDREYLLDLEPNVAHYEILAKPE